MNLFDKNTTVLFSAMSVSGGDRYDNAELFKSVDLDFFEGSGSDTDRPILSAKVSAASPTHETKGGSGGKRTNAIPEHALALIESLEKEPHGASGGNSSYSDASSSYSSSEGEAFDSDNGNYPLKIKSRKPVSLNETYEAAKHRMSDDDGAQLTDVSSISSSDSESATNVIRSVIRSNIGSKANKSGKSRNIKSALPGRRPMSQRSSASSRILDPGSDKADISKILKEVLDLEDDNSTFDPMSLLQPERPVSVSLKTSKKNLSISPYWAREIERENKRLLSKLTKPHRKPLCSGNVKLGPQKRASSATINRNKQLERIEFENNKILKRIETAKGSKFLKKEHLDYEHNENIRYALNCSKSKSIAGITDFPPNVSKYGSSDSRRNSSRVQRNSPMSAWD